MTRAVSGGNVRCAALALLLFAVANVVTGRLDVERGLGWDGEHYARVLRGDFEGVSQNILLRPIIPVLNAPAYWLLGDALSAFEAMNYVYVLLLALAVCSIFDVYSPDARGKTLLVVNLFLCIAVARMFAFYPTLIDLGACAVIVTATRIVLAGSWGGAAAAGIVAALSREFGACVAIFGFIRQVRMTGRVVPALLCWSPTVVAMLALRAGVSTLSGPVMLDAETLLTNAEYWANPNYGLVFLYFLLTSFGGVSLAIATAPAARRMGREEPEWLAFVLLIIPAAALTADIWRYLLYLLPVVPPLFASAWRAMAPARLRAYALTITAATLVTQRPWAPVDEFIYFRDWFPFYGQLGWVPEDLPVTLFPFWIWRPAIVALLAALLVIMRFPVPAAAWRRVAWSTAGIVAAFGAGAWALGFRPVLQSPSVGPREATVRWSSDVDTATRHRLEKAFRIEPFRDEGNRTWRYRFTGASRIDDLLRDRRVEDSHYFESFDWRWRYTYYLELFAPTRVSLARRHLPITRLE